MTEHHPKLYRDFVLDRLSDERREELEDEILHREASYEAALAAEAELLDAYLRGELEEEERTALEARLEGSERLQERLAFARCLDRVSREDLATGESPTPTPHRLRWPAAAAAVLALAMATWLALGPQLERKVDRDHLFTIQLAAGILRGPGSVPEETIPSGTTWLRFELELPDVDPGEPLEASFLTRGPRVAWSDSALHPTQVDGRSQLILEIPADELSPAHYQIEVRTEDDEERLAGFFELELIGSESPE